MKIIQFGEVVLNYYDEVETLGTGSAQSSNTSMPGGGSIDDFGQKQTFAGATQRNKNTVVALRTAGDLETELNKMKKLRGQRAKLTREDENGETQYQWARCISVGVSRTTEENRNNINKIQSVALLFSCDADTWLGDFEGAWQLNDGYKINDNLVLNGGEDIALVSSPQSFTISIPQDATESYINSLAPIFTVTAPVGTSFSSVLIETAEGGSLLFEGTVAAGKSVVIDCGSSQVLNDGVDAWDDLTIVYNPVSPNTWFTLFAETDIFDGDNLITVTHDGAEMIRADYSEEHI